jgi:hypothetical protein
VRGGIHQGAVAARFYLLALRPYRRLRIQTAEPALLAVSRLSTSDQPAPGTVMEHGRLPLTKWYLAIYLMTQSKTNIAALALMRQLGISWKAAWLLKHKLIEVMAQREAGRPLEGDISVDDAYLGGERTGGGPGRGSSERITRSNLQSTPGATSPRSNTVSTGARTWPPWCRG